MAHRVEAKALPDAMIENKRFASRMLVRLKTGKVLEGYEDYPKGSASSPLTKEELQEKFRRLASWALPMSQVEEIITTVNKLEQIRDMKQVVSLLVQRTNCS